MQSGHLWKFMYKKNLGITWVRGVVHWNRYGALQVSPYICEQNKRWQGWGYSRVLPPSHQYYIHIFSVSICTSCSRLNICTTTSKAWGTIFKNCQNTVETLQTKPGAPPRVEQTAMNPSPSRMKTHAPPRLKRRINARDPRVGTH